MCDVLGDPNVTTNQPRSQADKIEWSSKLSNCCDNTATGCYVCLCTSLMTSVVSEQYGEGFGLGVVPYSLMALRSEMRQRYNIKGSLCGDWCAGIFCAPCVVAQMIKEVNKRHPY